LKDFIDNLCRVCGRALKGVRERQSDCAIDDDRTVCTVQACDMIDDMGSSRASALIWQNWMCLACLLKVRQVQAQPLLTPTRNAVFTGQSCLCTRPIAGPEKWDEHKVYQIRHPKNTTAPEEQCEHSVQPPERRRGGRGKNWPTILGFTLGHCHATSSPEPTPRGWVAPTRPAAALW